MQGIQKEINCDPSHISRVLHYNMKKGFIRRKLSTIPGKKRKLNIFLLTKKGRQLGKELYDYVMKTKKK